MVPTRQSNDEIQPTESINSADFEHSVQWSAETTHDWSQLKIELKMYCLCVTAWQDQNAET